MLAVGLVVGDLGVGVDAGVDSGVEGGVGSPESETSPEVDPPEGLLVRRTPVSAITAAIITAAALISGTEWR